MHWLAFAVCLLICLMNIPLVMAFSIDETGYGFGFSAFSLRFALKKADERMLGEKKHLKMPDIKNIRLALKAFFPMISKFRLVFLRMSGEIGLSDASKTAKAFGFLTSAYHLVRSPSNALGSLSLKPNFVNPVISVKVFLAVEIKAYFIFKSLFRWIKSRALG